MTERSRPKLIIGNRYREIDGLRAIAAFLVIWAHAADMAGAISQRSITGDWYMDLARLGSSGVTLFFILSGFLITGILIDTKDSASKFKSFYIRRCLRIIPPYYLGILLIFILINCFSLSGGDYQMSWVFIYHLLFISNWVPFFDPDNIAASYADLAWFMHLWSLAVEQQFYLVWPAVFLAFYKDKSPRNMIFLICGLIVFSTVLRVVVTYSWYWQPAYIGTLTRMDALFAGAILAVVMGHSPAALETIKKCGQALLPLLCVILGAVFLATAGGGKSMNVNTVLIVPLTAVIYFFLVNAMIVPAKENLIRKLLKHKWIQHCGEISYGLYIFSLSAQIALGNMLIELGSKNFWINHIVILLPGFVITYMAAYLSYRFMEKPIMSWKNVLAPYGKPGS